MVEHVRPTPEIPAQGVQAPVDEFQGRFVHQPLDVGVELLVECFDLAAGPLDLRLDLADVFIDLRLLVGGKLLIVVGGKNLSVDDRHHRVVLLRGVDVKAALCRNAFDFLEDGVLPGGEPGLDRGEFLEVRLVLESLGDLFFQGR